MFDFIKEIHRKSLIRDLKAAPREKKIANIDQVRTIGVICELGDEQHWNIMHHFAKVMENQGKEVHIIALLEKDQELGFVITHQQTYLVRSKADTNFWGLPSGESVRDFLARSYDLLIDTIGGGNFFALYTALRAEASLKVVYATQEEDPSDVFDLIIKGDGEMDIKDYFNNVIEYLSMIQK
ncbi:MAG: hypothetical protein IJ760_06050 [Bacteroidales bacterium]|nr:hypothetical protein [Bacteroidales bacterium]